MDKLQQYGDELAEICEKHFPDVKRKIPKMKRRGMSSIDKLKNASHNEVCTRDNSSLGTSYQNLQGLPR